MARNNHDIFIVVTAVILAAVLHSCTEVEFGESEYTADNTGISFLFDWGGFKSEPEYGIPDEMTVLMSRIINTVHYAWVTDSTGKILSELKDTTAREETADSLAVVDNGTYYLMAVQENPKYYDISDLHGFPTDEEVSMKDFILTLNTPAEEEIDSIFSSGRIDFNSSIEHVYNPGPVFYEMQEVLRVFPDTQSEITIAPKSIAQKLTFRLNIDLDEGVRINEIVAEISGVGNNIELMSGTIDATRIYRSVFRMYETAVSDTVHTYEGDVYVFGLFPSKDRTLVTGPGILQLSIKAAYEDFSKSFHAGINLCETISGANLMTSLGNGLYRVEKEEAVLEILSTLTIRGDQIIPGNNDQGLDAWFDSEDNEFDIEL